MAIQVAGTTMLNPMRPTIETASGREFNFLEPTQDSISIEDIAHALSNICRYTGHVRDFYSVAQHSVLVARIVEEMGRPELALRALLHDAAEAYIGDVSSPLKKLLPEYRRIEAIVSAAIDRKFGFDGPEPPEVRRADYIALLTEKRDLMPNTGIWPEYRDIAPRERPASPMEPFRAETLFLNKYHELRTIQHHAVVLSRAAEPQCATVS